MDTVRRYLATATGEIEDLTRMIQRERVWLLSAEQKIAAEFTRKESKEFLVIAREHVTELERNLSEYQRIVSELQKIINAAVHENLNSLSQAR